MKKFIYLLIFALAVTNYSCGSLKGNKKMAQTDREDPKNSVDSVSYAFGISIGMNLKNQKITNLNPDVLAQAIKDVNDSTYEQKMTEKEANLAIQKFFDDIEAEKHGPAIKAGKDFLAENAKKEGVITTESGLQYKVISQGDGKTPTREDKVKTHYAGTLIDGTKFDSSYDRGQPATFGVTQVITGWTEALLLMKEGDKWELYIPYDLAYGSRDQGTIKPFSTLIFTIELISIEK